MADSAASERTEELIRQSAANRWQDRYGALEQARDLPRDLRRRVASAFIHDENNWVRTLATLLAGDSQTTSRSSRRIIVHDFDRIVRGARLTLDQRTDLIRLFENAEESGSFAYLALAADRAARLVTGSLSAAGDQREDYLMQLERFLKHVGAYAGPARISNKSEQLSSIVAYCVGRTRARVIAEQSLQVRVNRDAASRALDELFSNAADAGASHVTLRMSQNNGHVTIRAANDGPPIEARAAERLFEPWYTTKTGRAGLGLFLARQAIKEAGGVIDALKTDLPEFELTLPATE